MTTVLSILGVVMALALFDLALMAYLWKLQKNRFDVTRDDSHAFKVKTDFGVFTIDRRERLLRAEGEDSNEGIPLEWIERFDFAFRTERAVWNQFILAFNSFDFVKTYEDWIQCYRISVVDAEGKQTIPVFEVGQYLPREPFTTRYRDYQARILGRFGLFNDAQERAHDVLAQLQGAFAASGHPITLTPDWVKAKKAATEASSKGATFPNVS